jgi:hypothetical protein
MKRLELLSSLSVLVALWSANASADDWIIYQSTKYAFTAEFLVTPKETVGKNQMLSLDALGGEAGIQYGIDVLQLPDLAVANDSVIESVMTSARDEIVKEFDGKLITDCAIESSGLRGREFTATGIKNDLPVLICCRNLVADGRLYVLRVNRTGEAKLDVLDVMRFFGAFKHKSAKAEPKGKLQFKGVAFGEWAESNKLRFRVTHASVERVKVHRTVFNDLVWSDNQFLFLRLEINNADERRIVRVANSFLKVPFGMFDDVENVIRGVNFGATAKPAGQISPNDDINPETTTKTVAVFNIPPSKTKGLTLIVNLDQFGGKGNLLLDVPVAKIKNFRAEK